MSNETQLCLDFGRALAVEVAPEELPFFDELAAKTQSQKSHRSDHELGFGGEVLLVGAVSAFLFEASKTVLAFLWEQAQGMFVDLAKTAAKEARVEFEDKIKTWVKKRFEGRPPVSLPPDRLQNLLDIIRKDATESGVSEPELARLTATLSRVLRRP